MKQHIILLVIFLSACGGAVIEEQWPNNTHIIVGEREVKDYEPQTPDPIEAKEFSLVQGKPIILITTEEHSLTLLRITERGAILRLDNTSFTLAENASIVREGMTLTMNELASDSVPVPRKSVVDISVGGNRQLLNPGEGLSVNNITLYIDFIGLQDDVPKVRVILGEQSEILAENEEHYFDEVFVYVHGVFFNDATEYDLADAVTLTVQ